MFAFWRCLSQKKTMKWLKINRGAILQCGRTCPYQEALSLLKLSVNRELTVSCSYIIISWVWKGCTNFMFIQCCSVGFSRRTVKLLDGKYGTGYGRLGTPSFGWKHKGLGQGIFNIKKLYCWSTPSPPPPPLGGTPYSAYTRRILPKGVPFSGFRYIRGFISIREGNFVNLVYKKEYHMHFTAVNNSSLVIS